MRNFEFKNPTKVIFGKDQIVRVNDEVPTNAKVLLLYGGGSIKANGIYDQVKTALGSREVLEMGGIPPNPEYSVLIKAVDIIKKENITYLLAVGGGSVIDGTKFISAAAKYTGDNSWDILTKQLTITDALPFGTVLTLPATGSEMNAGAVVTNKVTKEKLAFRQEAVFPQFSILDPTVIKSIPPRQIANGLADAFVHVLEQYVTYPADAMLQDRFAESILQTLIEVAPAITKDAGDYKAASNFMWSCTMALNGLIGQGVPGDWSIHGIGHELTALFGIDHARTLAIVTKSSYTFLLETKKEKLAQLAERIFNITEGSTEEKAVAGINAIEAYFHSLGIETKLSDYTKEYEGTAELIADRFTKRGWKGIGETGTLTPANVAEIVKMTY